MVHYGDIHWNQMDIKWMNRGEKLTLIVLKVIWLIIKFPYFHSIYIYFAQKNGQIHGALT